MSIEILITKVEDWDLVSANKSLSKWVVQSKLQVSQTKARFSLLLS